MTTYKWIGPGKVVDASRVRRRYEAGKAPNVISDEMAPTCHMATGKYMTSKRAFSQATRDAGCVEVGNDPAIYGRPRAPVAFDRNTRRQQVRESIRRQLHGGRA